MGYKRTDTTVYIVHWPAIGAFKVGCSERQRWRTFLLRGADLLSLTPFGNAVAAYQHEGRLHQVASSTCRPAFGSRGDGFAECYRVPDGRRATEIPLMLAGMLNLGEHQSGSAQAGDRAYAPPMLQVCSSNAHTDAPTYEHLLTLLDHLPLSNARRGVHRNRSTGDLAGLTASAPRGRNGGHHG